MKVELVAADDTTLYALFSAVRADELGMAAWDPAMRSLVLRQQFEARQRGYRAQHPGARDALITVDGAPAGWALLDRTVTPWLVVDIAVTRDWRRRGVATRVIRAWQDEARAAGSAIALMVMHGNAAARAVYDRLGFRVVAEDETHLHMEWRP